MERIQQAIAKARAERNAYGNDETDPVLPLGRATVNRPRPPGNEDPPVDTPIGEVERNDEALARAWRELAPLEVDRRVCRRNHLVSVTGGIGAAEVDAVRTRLLQQFKTRGFRSVAITSPGAGCGKTTVAVNLAFSLGRQPDQRTILAGIDFRRPHLAKMLGVKERHSFASVLEKEASFAQHALRYGDNLAFATTHGPIGHPAELLQSRGAAEALGKIRTDYEPTVMMFDLPPLHVNDDAMAFLGHVDCALIVAAAGKTTIKEIDRCEREVATQTAVLGVILNRCRFMDRADGYSTYRS